MQLPQSHLLTLNFKRKEHGRTLRYRQHSTEAVPGRKVGNLGSSGICFLSQMTSWFFFPQNNKNFPTPVFLTAFSFFLPWVMCYRRSLACVGTSALAMPPLQSFSSGPAPKQVTYLGLQYLVGFRQNSFLRKCFLWLAQKCLYRAPFQWQLCPGAHRSLASIIQCSLHCPPAPAPQQHGGKGGRDHPHVEKQQHSNAQRLFETREWDFHI